MSVKTFNKRHRFSIASITFLVVLILSKASCRQQQGSYDEKVAKKLLAMSGAAYALVPDECIFRTFPAEEKWRREVLHNELCDMLGNFCSGFVAVSEIRRQLIVAFRGTRGKAQLIHEIFSSIRPQMPFFQLGKVNEYFFRGLEVLWPNIEPVLKNPKYQDFNISFTGHSLGGALAVLAAARTVVEGIRQADKIVVYTFGEPRVGNSEFANNYNRMIQSSFRVVHDDDIVPHVPLCSENIMGQKSKPCDPQDPDTPFHQGVEIWYPNDMSEGSSYIECREETYGEEYTCSNRRKYHIYKIYHYIEKHLHYFAKRVSAYGRSGCIIRDPRKKTLPYNVTGSNRKSPAEGKKSGGIVGLVIRCVKSLGQLFGIW